MFFGGVCFLGPISERGVAIGRLARRMCLAYDRNKTRRAVGVSPTSTLAVFIFFTPLQGP